jgi:CheY-like chemotaxis protein
VNQRLALRQLQKLGQEVDVVGNGKEVLEALENKDYDILLLDCQMPELDGYETACHIRRRETQTAAGAARSRAPLRIVAMTANAGPDARAKCLAAGMDDYVSKPVRIEDLEVLLRRTTSIEPSHAAEAQASSDESLDLSMIRALRGLCGPDQVDPAAELIDMFIRDGGACLDKMRLALQAGDAALLRSSSHSLKGSSSNLGARRLSSMCARMQKLAEACELAEVTPTLDQACSEFARVRGLLLAEKERKT